MSLTGTNRTNRTGLTMSVDWGRPEVTGGRQNDAFDPKRSSCPEQTSCKQFDIASDQSPIVSMIGRGDIVMNAAGKPLPGRGEKGSSEDAR